MATIETIPGTKAIAQRLVNGELEFERTLMELGGMDATTAENARIWMAKKKLTVRDFCTGRITVKHGAYLDRDVLGRIAAQVTQ